MTDLVAMALEDLGPDARPASVEAWIAGYLRHRNSVTPQQGDTVPAEHSDGATP